MKNVRIWNKTFRFQFEFWILILWKVFPQEIMAIFMVSENTTENVANESDWSKCRYVDIEPVHRNEPQKNFHEKRLGRKRKGDRWACVACVC